MLLTVFEEINFTAVFRYKIWDRKVDKNDFNFNKQYVKKHILKNIYTDKKCKKY